MKAIDWIVYIVCFLSIATILYYANNMGEEIQARDRYWQEYMDYYDCYCYTLNKSSEQYPIINWSGYYEENWNESRTVEYEDYTES